MNSPETKNTSFWIAVTIVAGVVVFAGANNQRQSTSTLANVHAVRLPALSRLEATWSSQQNLLLRPPTLEARQIGFRVSNALSDAQQFTLSQELLKLKQQQDRAIRLQGILPATIDIEIQESRDKIAEHREGPGPQESTVERLTRHAALTRERDELAYLEYKRNDGTAATPRFALPHQKRIDHVNRTLRGDSPIGESSSNWQMVLLNLKDDQPLHMLVWDYASTLSPWAFGLYGTLLILVTLGMDAIYVYLRKTQEFSAPAPTDDQPVEEFCLVEPTPSIEQRVELTLRRSELDQSTDSRHH